MKKELQSKDLRIGNRIIYMGAEIVIEGINRNGDLDYTLNGHPYGGHNVRHYESIPLTKEWLIKFEFYPSAHDIRFWRKGSVMLKLTDKGFKFNYGISIRYIQSVHQLQNLYFALTGNELELKNNSIN